MIEAPYSLKYCYLNYDCYLSYYQNQALREQIFCILNKILNYHKMYASIDGIPNTNFYQPRYFQSIICVDQSGILTCNTYSLDAHALGKETISMSAVLQI